MHVCNLIHNNYEIEILGVLLPIFPRQMLIEKENTIKKIIDCFKIFEQENVNIITLAGFTSIVTNGGRDVSKMTSIPITSGNATTAVLASMALEKEAGRHGKKVRELSVAIIGATGDIGSICARIYSKKAKFLRLCSRTISDDSEICKKLKAEGFDQFVCFTDAREAVSDADLIIAAASSVDALLGYSDFKEGSIICDIGMPPNVSFEKSGLTSFPAKKTLFFGGTSELPFYKKIFDSKWKSFFPQNAIYGCLTEAIILAFSKRFDLVSLGRGEISSENLEGLADLILKYRIFPAVKYL